MNGYVTQQRLARTLHVPIAAAQTELRAGKSLMVATIKLEHGQRLDIRSLTLNVIRVLTSGVLPILRFAAYGVCSIGVYSGQSDACPLVFTSAAGNASSTSNANRHYTIMGPGTYTVVLRNNTTNVDLSVAASGAAKLYY